MNIKELSDLINVRNYVSNSINNHSIKRETVNQLHTTLILLDKMLTSEITSDSFKQLINFDSAAEVIREVVEINNIKHNMNSNNKVVTVNEGKPEVK